MRAYGADDGAASATVRDSLAARGDAARTDEFPLSIVLTTLADRRWADPAAEASGVRLGLGESVFRCGFRALSCCDVFKDAISCGKISCLLSVCPMKLSISISEKA